jgi:hypothetical protein
MIYITLSLEKLSCFLEKNDFRSLISHRIQDNLLKATIEAKLWEVVQGDSKKRNL